jgi:hypothetical protein
MKLSVRQVVLLSLAMSGGPCLLVAFPLSVFLDHTDIITTFIISAAIGAVIFIGMFGALYASYVK